MPVGNRRIIEISWQPTAPAALSCPDGAAIAAEPGSAACGTAIAYAATAS